MINGTLSVLTKGGVAGVESDTGLGEKTLRGGGGSHDRDLVSSKRHPLYRGGNLRHVVNLAGK